MFVCARDGESSGNISSEDESSDEEMSETTGTKDGRSEPDIQDKDASDSADWKDVPLQPELPPQGPLSEADIVLARLARYRKIRSEPASKTMLSNPTDSNTLSTVGQARATLGKLEGLSLVDFKKYEEDLKFAIQSLLEEGGLLLGSEKAELSLLPDKLHKIFQENERIRKELAYCRTFMEKLQECEENTIKLMEKAKILEGRHNVFLHNTSTLPNKVDGIEAALHHDKAHAEKIKFDKENVATDLTRASECLQSAIIRF